MNNVYPAIRDGIRGIIRSIARFLDRVTGGKLTPDMVTWTGVGMHLPIAFCIARSQFLVAGILLIIFGLFDVLDGELARLQKRASPHGMVLDATTDRVKIVILFSAISYVIGRGPHAEWAFTAVIAAGSALTVSYAKAKGEVALAIAGTVKDHHTLNRYFKEGLIPFEIYMAIIAVGLLTGAVFAATVVLAVLSTLSIFLCLRTVLRAIT